MTRSSAHHCNSSFHWSLKLALGILALALLVSMVLTPGFLATPEMSEASWFATTDQAVASDTSAEAVDAQATGDTAADSAARPEVRGRVSLFRDRRSRQKPAPDDPLAAL